MFFRHANFLLSEPQGSIIAAGKGLKMSRISATESTSVKCTLNVLVLTLWNGEGAISQEQAHLWRERYRILFDQNVAGISLTNVERRILDCNEPCARIFGFESRDTCSRIPPGISISTGQSAKL